MKKEYCSKNSNNVQAQNVEFSSFEELSDGPIVPFIVEHSLKHIHFECIDSTNNWAKRNLDQWSENGMTLITASEQTAGRGRFKRVWVSPPHLNIYGTFCFWIDLARQDCGHIPQLLALKTAQILKIRGFQPTIKWPNDILLSGKKVGGILCETILQEKKRGVICGIGLNVNMPQEWLDQIDRPATSLLVEHNQEQNPEEIISQLKKEFSFGIQQFMRSGFTPFFSSYQELSYLKKGQLVRFHDNHQLIEAEFDALLPDGSLRLILPNKLSKIYFAGEFIE